MVALKLANFKITKAYKIDNSQLGLFKNRLSDQLNPKHELFILANKLVWEKLEEEFSGLYVDNSKGGQLPKPVRLMVSLLLLQYLHNLSDEQVVRAWAEKGYYS